MRDERTWAARAAAVLEGIAVLLCGILLQRLTQAALGLPSWKGLQQRALDGGAPDFLALAWASFSEQALKYGFIFLLAWAIGRWHRRRRLAAYGLTRGGSSLGRLAAIGVVLYAAAGLPPYLLQTAAQLVPALGQGPEHWRLFPDAWSWSFVLYMAAASFVWVPLVEELFARGYLVRRLEEDFGAAGAVLLSALFFSLAHGQYFRLEVLSLGMLASLFLGAGLSAWVFLRTGSLVPVVVAHALVNLPTPPSPWSRPAQLAVCLVILALARRPARCWLGELAGELRAVDRRAVGLGAALLVALLALVFIGRSQLPLVAAATLAAALGLESRDRAPRAASGGEST